MISPFSSSSSPVAVRNVSRPGAGRDADTLRVDSEGGVDSIGWLSQFGEQCSAVGKWIDAMTEARVERPLLEVSMGENLAGTEVWASVRDNGPGIELEQQDKIFTPFYTSRSNGTGLGLAITRKLVEAHGGAIELSSTPGKGTEFLVSFPKTQTDGGSR